MYVPYLFIHYNNRIFTLYIMKVTKLSDRALLIEFPSRKEMNLTCFRMSEFSEGLPELRKFYTPDVFIDMLSTDKGNLKYFSYWEGHNISKNSIIHFATVFSGNLSKREDAIMREINKIDPNGYVIFAEEGDETTIKHEKAHLYYYEHSEYKIKADLITSEITGHVISEIKKGLTKEGYTEQVLFDEVQAYMVAYDEDEFKEMFPKVKKSDVIEYSTKLNELYNQFDK